TWPLYPEAFYALIDPHAAHHQVADSEGALVGLAAGSWDGHSGHLFAIVVHPDHRGKGVESGLLAAATQHFRNLGVTNLRFGGGQSYFWPGVPTEETHLLQLLQLNGWRSGGELADMVADLTTSQVPEEIMDRVTRSGAHLRLASPRDGSAILAFEEKHF